MISYAEFYCLTNFSFLRGGSHPEEIVARAAQLNYHAIAITDECSVAGAVKAHVAAKKSGIKIIIGSEFVVGDISFIAIAPNKLAYGQLCSYITLCRQRAEKGHYKAYISDLKRHLTNCFIIWPPTISNPIDNRIDNSSEPGKDLALFIELTEPRLWLGLTQNRSQHDGELALKVKQLANWLDRPIIACGAIHTHHPDRQPLQDILTAIRLNCSVHDAGFNLKANREQHLKSLTSLVQLFPAKAMLETVNLAKACTFSLDEIRYQYPKELIPPNYTATSYLKDLVTYGEKSRWPEGTPKKVSEQINKELKIITELGYEYYFITVYDIVAYARSQHILCQGRGSAANSAVCFCLFITEVDPAKSTLLFERFISKERDEPPDIDVDFEHERREEVIQFIYRKYGRERAALAATVITYRPKSAIRDVGKALGLDLSLIEHLLSHYAWWDRKEELTARLTAGGINKDNATIQQFIDAVTTLLTFPRHLSQHVGGFIISATPLNQIVPIENASMQDRTVVQWDKEDIEALGLLKIDVLALGMLSAIRKSFALIESLRHKKLTMAGLPQEDPKVYEMLQHGDSIGVFQVESRAQMAMLPRLRPARFYDLVIEVAIVRPGPIQGNMVHPFLKRRQGLEPISYPSDEVKEVLSRTLGVPIFQEQVIQLAMVAAGFSGGEADQLRRAMASWRKKGELIKYQAKLTNGLLTRGYTEEFAERIIEQINGFGEYGFPESHAASFALLVYVSAWLKCHEPAAFCCALLNSQPMGFYSPFQLIQDAKRHNVKVLPIDICHSNWDCTLEPSDIPENPRSPQNSQPAIRLGLRLVKGLSTAAAEKLELLTEQPELKQKPLQELQQKLGLKRQDLDALAQANALYSISGHRFQSRWEVQSLKPTAPLFAEIISSQNKELQDSKIETSVELTAPTETENLFEDYASTGLTLGRHPLAILRSQGLLGSSKRAADLKNIHHKGYVCISGLITGRQRPGSAKGVIFLTLEDETGNSNIVIWQSVLERQRKIILQAKLLTVKGTVEREERVIHVIAGSLIDNSHLLENLHTRSRDFH